MRVDSRIHLLTCRDRSGAVDSADCADDFFGCSTSLLGGETTTKEQQMTSPAEDSHCAASQECAAVKVSVRIEADAATVFSVLADPRRHVEIDGSGMLRGAVTDAIVTGVGDVFVQKMYYSRHGD